MDGLPQGRFTAIYSTHDITKPYFCRKCPQTFQKHKYLNRHKKRIHSEIVFQCPICKKGFRENWNLQKHMKIHLQMSQKKRKSFEDIHPRTRNKRVKQEAAEIEDRLNNQPKILKSLVLHKLDTQNMFEELDKKIEPLSGNVCYLSYNFGEKPVHGGEFVEKE